MVMKWCEYCGKEYPDDTSECPFDKRRLVSIVKKPSTPLFEEKTNVGRVAKGGMRSVVGLFGMSLATLLCFVPILAVAHRDTSGAPIGLMLIIAAGIARGITFPVFRYLYRNNYPGVVPGLIAGGLIAMATLSFISGNR
jgi:hypothetical protein